MRQEFANRRKRKVIVKAELRPLKALTQCQSILGIEANARSRVIRFPEPGLESCCETTILLALFRAT